MEEHSERPPIVLVDASNVAYGGGLFKSPTVHVLARTLDELGRHNFRVAAVADASLRHTIDDPARLEEMIQSGRLIQAPAGRAADDFLLQLALRRQERGEAVYILTNDLFPTKSARGVVPRIAFIHFSFHDVDELVFSPPLESVRAYIKDEEPDAREGRRATGAAPPELDRELLDATLSFFESMEPPLKEGVGVPFTRLAGYLHNQFNGDFCRRFGLRRPKELALALERLGYARISGATPMYLEALPKLVERASAPEGPTPPPAQASATEPPQPAPSGPERAAERAALEAVMEALRRENHFATEERISAKLRELFPGRGLQARAVISWALDTGLITADEQEGLSCYWPASGRWSALNPDDPTDPYPEEAWRAFKESLKRLPLFRRTSQTRYHLALHLGRFGLPLIADLPQAFREHMVQLAVRKKILVAQYTMVGTRIDVPSGE